MPVEILLGVTVLSQGGTTTVPMRVQELLGLKPTPDRREKILWTEGGDEIVVSKGTPQSSFRKTMLRRGGRAAVPRHIMKALKLKSKLHDEDKVLWLQKGNQVIVRKGTPKSIPTDYVF
ncbi:MAG TPA: hypothetical protein VIW22_06685 [Nitrososphaerales archaeon]